MARHAAYWRGHQVCTHGIWALRPYAAPVRGVCARPAATWAPGHMATWYRDDDQCPVAWIRAVSASLLLSADAGAGRRRSRAGEVTALKPGAQAKTTIQAHFQSHRQRALTVPGMRSPALSVIVATQHPRDDIGRPEHRAPAEPAVGTRLRTCPDVPCRLPKPPPRPCDEWRVGRGYIAKHPMEPLLQERLHPSQQEGILELQPP